MPVNENNNYDLSIGLNKMLNCDPFDKNLNITGDDICMGFCWPSIRCKYWKEKYVLVTGTGRRSLVYSNRNT